MHNKLSKLQAIPYTPTYGGLKKALETEWNLSPTIKYDHLLHHFILYWSKEYFKKQYEQGDGTIYKEGRLYRVIFHNCSYEDCTKLTDLQQIALSFRVAHHKYCIHPIVLVSCASSATRKIHQMKHKPQLGKHSEVSHIPFKKQK